MEFRRRHLLLMMIAVFVISMSILNVRYDSLNRVPGIDHYSRELIKTYLDEDEQKYLVEQAIKAQDFIPYIQEPGFSIYRHSIYKMLHDLQLVSTPIEIVTQGNVLYDRFSEQDVLLDSMALLISTLDINSMFYDFMSELEFKVDLIYVYDFIRNKLEIVDSSYVLFGNTLYDNLVNQGFNKRGVIEQKLDEINNRYLGLELRSILDQIIIFPSRNLVMNPLQIEVLVNEYHTIGNFTLKSEQIVKVGDFIHSNNQEIFVRKELHPKLQSLCEQLTNLNKDKACGGMILKSGYLHPDQLAVERRGIDDRQLGLTIEISFEKEDVLGSSEYQWLIQNAHKYGFILRYPESQIEQTKQAYQPYLFRYVGEKIANEIYQSKGSLESYDGT